MGTLDPSLVLNNLQIDKMNVDTQLAKKYLETKNGTFYSYSSLNSLYDSKKTLQDSYGNKIFCVDASFALEVMNMKFGHHCHRVSDSELSRNLRKLAQEIVKETDLFCQLEFLIRNINLDDTKHSIHLMVQNLLHTSVEDDGFDSQDSVIINDRTPLLVLGFLCQIFLRCDQAIIVATKEAAAVCSLFTEICCKVGWKNRLLFIEDNYIQEIQKKECLFNVFPDIFDGVAPEITGIITERSDLDSAIDVLLNAGNHPFRLTRIFIQESIYEDFKKIMTWKCELKHDKNCKNDKFNSKCSNVFQYDDKLFLLDFAGNSEEVKNDCHCIIFVEAYRTVNELLSLLNKSHRRLCLSLWASGISEANEIALRLNIPILWINDHSNFKGPDELSQAIYKRIKFRLHEEAIYNSSVVKQLQKNQQTWCKKTYIERCVIVTKGIKDFNKELGEKFEVEALDWKINNFISKENETIVLGFNEPVEGVIGFNQSGNDIFAIVVKALVNGNAVAVNGAKAEFKCLLREDVPIALEVKGDEGSSAEFKISFRRNNWIQQTKVVFTNYGTTFAN